MLTRLAAFEQQKLRPALIAYMTHPVQVIFLVVLGILLIVFGWIVAFSLIGNGYLNALSGLATCLTLATVGVVHEHVKRISVQNEQTHAIGAAHQAMQLKHAEVATNLTNTVASLQQQIADRDDALASHLNIIHEALGSHLVNFHAVLKEQVDVNKKVLAAVQPQPRQKRVTTAPAPAPTDTTTTTPQNAPTATPEGTAAV